MHLHFIADLNKRFIIQTIKKSGRTGTGNRPSMIIHCRTRTITRICPKIDCRSIYCRLMIRLRLRPVVRYEGLNKYSF